MGERNTDRRNKQMLARYAECGNYHQVAREFGVSVNTVRRRVKNEPEIAQKLIQKKEQNTLDMLAYMDARKKTAQDLMDQIMEAMTRPDKLALASERELATAFGILADKFIHMSPRADDETLRRAAEILGGVDGVIK